MIGNTDLPAAYQAADAASLKGQRRFLSTLKLRLGGYILAAIGGALSWKVKTFDVWGAVAALALLTALSAEFYSVRSKPDRSWYDGRAAAESAKTLAWRYMVGGAPFVVSSVASVDVDAQFAVELRSINQDLDDLDAPPVEEAQQQITDAMRRHRASSFEDRRRLYDLDRIEDQRGWYAAKANWNTTRANAYQLAALVLQSAGLVAATLKAFTVVSIDLLGVVGAIGGGLLGWSQARQHRTLASAYSIAAQELASIRSLMNQDRDEDEWSQFVNESEEAISREHTLWRASRGA